MTSKRDRVRLYHQLRTAHLERAAQLPAATIVYGARRYDFEDALAAQLDLVQARGWRAALFMLRTPIEVLEVNEPLMTYAARSTALALLGLRLRELAGGARTRVVSYAIENLDPRDLPGPARAKHRISRRLDLFLGRVIWRRLDRMAYGTQAAADVYTRALPQTGRRPEARVIPALPSPAAESSLAKDSRRVLYLGAFVQRKGFPLVIRAWDEVRTHHPDARLTVVGKGALQPLADDAAAADPSIDVLIDPPREQIRELLRDCQILVLPSQPSPRWREQVGLPLVEGLSYGCTLVTTTETGIASWLAEHSHRVLPADADAKDLAAALLDALADPLPASAVLASLPAVDGRLAADAWLFSPPEPVEGPRPEPDGPRPEPVGPRPEPVEGSSTSSDNGTRPEPDGPRPEPDGPRPEPVEGPVTSHA